MRLTEERLSRLPADRPITLPNHYPVLQRHARVMGSEHLPLWRWTEATEPWLVRFPIKASCTAICTYRPPQAKATSPLRRCRAVIHANMTDGARYAARPSDLTGPVARRGQKGKTIRVAITCAAHSICNVKYGGSSRKAVGGGAGVRTGLVTWGGPSGWQDEGVYAHLKTQGSLCETLPHRALIRSAVWTVSGCP